MTLGAGLRQYLSTGIVKIYKVPLRLSTKKERCSNLKRAFSAKEWMLLIYDRIRLNPSEAINMHESVGFI